MESNLSPILNLDRTSKPLPLFESPQWKEEITHSLPLLIKDLQSFPVTWQILVPPRKSSPHSICQCRVQREHDLLDLFRPWASLTGVRMRPDGGGRMGSNYPDQLSLLRRHFTGQLPSVRLLARDQVWSVTSSDYLSWRGIDQPSFSAFCWRSVECWCEQAVCWPQMSTCASIWASVLWWDGEYWDENVSGSWLQYLLNSRLNFISSQRNVL